MQYKNLPRKVKRIIDNFGDDTGYDNLEELKRIIQKYGYTFEYELDGGITQFSKYDNTEDKRALLINQIELQEKIQALANINIVTCGHCGSIVLHEREAEEIDCPYCEHIVDVCDCPDYLYSGIENNLVP